MPSDLFCASLIIHFSWPADLIENAGGVLLWPLMKGENCIKALVSEKASLQDCGPSACFTKETNIAERILAAVLFFKKKMSVTTKKIALYVRVLVYHTML